MNADPAIGVAWAPSYEHFDQYLFAGSLVAGRRVLAVEHVRGDDALLLAARADEVVVVTGGSAAPKVAMTPHNVTFLHGDLLHLSESATGRFDVVTCFDAPGSPSDLSKLLGETARVLVPGGDPSRLQPDPVCRRADHGGGRTIPAPLPVGSDPRDRLVTHSARLRCHSRRG